MSDKISQIEDPLSQGEEASLELCNLVSRGMSVSEARAYLKEFSDGGKGEAVAPRGEALNDLGLPIGHPSDLDGLKAALEAAGKPQHPNAKLEKVLARYKAEFIKEAEETPDEQ